MASGSCRSPVKREAMDMGALTIHRNFKSFHEALVSLCHDTGKAVVLLNLNNGLLVAEFSMRTCLAVGQAVSPDRRIACMDPRDDRNGTSATTKVDPAQLPSQHPLYNRSPCATRVI